MAIQLSLGRGQVNSRATREELIVELGEKEREKEVYVSAHGRYITGQSSKPG